MTKYRKKAIVIEAFQMTKERRWDNSEWPGWLQLAWQKEVGEGALFPEPGTPPQDQLYIVTLEGMHKVEWNDWIIQGVKGEIYPCKPDIFELTYEEVTDDG